MNVVVILRCSKIASDQISVGFSRFIQEQYVESLRSAQALCKWHPAAVR